MPPWVNISVLVRMGFKVGLKSDYLSKNILNDIKILNDNLFKKAFKYLAEMG